MPTCPSCRKQYPEGRETCPDDGDRLLPDEAFGAADADLTPGQVVGEYKIETKLGEGGFGAVYRAVHPLIGKAAAIKVLHRQYSSNPQMVSRFIAEARAVNQIRHRNIIDIFSFGTLEDGRQYYMMELLEGMTFDKYIRSTGKLTPEQAIPILRQIARALDAAHAAGIAHRDLKPENLFLSFDGDGGVFPKLLDFGIAKLLGESMAGHKTRTGTPIGTPNYMSPEQCRGKNVDQRTDVYSFGILVHESLTGQLPFVGEDVMDILFKHTSAPAPTVSSACPGLSSELDAPVLKMLEKDPANRPRSLSDAVEAIAQAAKRAGHNVELARTGDPNRSGPILGPAVGEMATADLGALAEARTIAQGQSGRTLQGAASDLRPNVGRGAYIAIGLLMLVGGGAALGYALMVRRAPDPPTSASMAGSETTASAARIESAVPTVRPDDSAAGSSASASPAAAAEVEVTVQAEPVAVEVFLGAQRLGTAPEPIRLKQGSAKVKLTLKANGYRSTDVEVTPSANTVVTAKLDKIPARGGTKKSSGDLENPF